MRYRLITTILAAVSWAGNAWGQACFLDDGYSAIGGFVGAATSDEQSGAFGGVLISQNARADFSLDLQTVSYERGSAVYFHEQYEHYLMRQRIGGAPIYWSIGQSYAIHLPFGDEGVVPRPNLLGFFTTLSRSFWMEPTAALRPGAGLFWQKASDNQKPAEWGAVVAADFAVGSGKRGTLFVFTLGGTDSFGPGGQTSLSLTVSLVGIKEHQSR